MNLHRSGTASLALVLASCSTYGTRDFDFGRTAGSFLGSKSEKGLTVSAESLTRPDRTERFLWFDTTAHGFLPIVVRLKSTASTAFRIERTGMRCVLRDGTSLAAAPIDEVITDLSYGFFGSVPYWLLGIVPGVWSAFHRSATNTDLASDYEEKHLFLDKTALRVGEDDQIVGVVFFRLKEPGRRPDLTEALLEVKVVKERGTEGGDVEELTLRPQVE